MAATDRPNVIVFFTDQQRWDTAGVHGNPAGLTPNFDRMAVEGTHLFNSFTCQPVCGPARSCLQTGRYATETGVWQNGPGLPDDLPTLAGLFGAAGYRTGYLGKWHLSTAGPCAVPREQRGGYRDWLASNVLEFTSDAYRTRMYDGAGDAVDLPGYRVDAVADAAIRYVDARARETDPFFLFLSFIEPHFQNSRDDYPAPTGYEERYTGTWVPPDLAALGGSTHQHLAGYYGMVRAPRRGAGAAAGRAAQPRPAALHGAAVHHRPRLPLQDPQRRVQAFLPRELGTAAHRPDRPRLRRRRPRAAAHQPDRPAPYPARRGRHHPRPRRCAVVRLLPLLSDPAARANWPDDVFIQISESQVGRAVRTARWKYGVTAPGIDGRQQPAADRYREQYLYDLLADRYELNNLAGSTAHAEVARRLRRRLLRHLRAVEGAEPAIEAAGARTAGNIQVGNEELAGL